MGKTNRNAELLPGTLDMLVLKTLRRSPMHGYGISRHVQQASEGVLRVGEGSLYPALQRLLAAGWVAADWGVSENNRRARYYKLTPAGRKRLGAEMEDFGRIIGAIARVMQAE
jgi:PadR family transcriptional regulator, regulatory protein PadR